MLSQHIIQLQHSIICDQHFNAQSVSLLATETQHKGSNGSSLGSPWRKDEASWFFLFVFSASNFLQCSDTVSSVITSLQKPPPLSQKVVSETSEVQENQVGLANPDSKRPPWPFYGRFLGPPGWAGARRELLLQGARWDLHRQTQWPSGWAPLHPD